MRATIKEAEVNVKLRDKAEIEGYFSILKRTCWDLSHADPSIVIKIGPRGVSIGGLAGELNAVVRELGSILEVCESLLPKGGNHYESKT